MAKEPRMVHRIDKTVLNMVHKAQTTATPIFLPFSSYSGILMVICRSEVPTRNFFGLSLRHCGVSEGSSSWPSWQSLLWRSLHLTTRPISTSKEINNSTSGRWNWQWHNIGKTKYICKLWLDGCFTREPPV